MKLTTVIIPVAGFGTRLLPATKAIPKAMLPVGDRPSIHHLVQEAFSSGVTRVIFVTGSGIGKAIVKKYFRRDAELEKMLRASGKRAELRAARTLPNGMRLYFVSQPKICGNADAIARALRFVRKSEPVAVMFGDDLVDARVPALTQMAREYKRFGSTMLAIARVPRATLSRYGAISGKKIRGNVFRVQHIVEKPHGHALKAVEPYAVIGRYILSPDIYRLIPAVVRQSRMRPKTGTEVSLTDALAIYMKSHELLALKLDGRWFDCGNRKGYLLANINYSEHITHPANG